MTRTSTKILKCLFFSLILLFTIGFNQTIQAQTATAPAAGDGSLGNPYQIATLDNLYWIAANSSTWSSQFIQTANIDASSTSGWFSGEGWNPIGNFTTKFTGVYDGGNFTISGLTVNRPSGFFGGLFGYVSGNAQFRNLGMINVSISCDQYSGGIIALADDTGTRVIENVYSTGTVSSNRSAGGIVGVGGNCEISNSYSRANVTGSDFGESGGLVGSLFNLPSFIINSYSTGVVSGTTGTNGTEQGGLVGSTTRPVTNSFWDTETSNQLTSAGGTGKTTAEMKTQSTFTDAGWDFPSTWTFCSNLNNGYPILTSFTGEITSVAPAGSGTVGAPYQIATLANLKWITESSARWASHYIQTANIDASSTANWNCGAGWSPIGNVTTNFTGTYNGGNYTIRNLTLNRTAFDDYTGLFGRLSTPATISNLGLVNASFNGGGSSGILSGDANSVTIRNVYSTGSVSGTGFSLGGLVGANINVDIIDSYSNANVGGGAVNKGGLAGEVDNGSAIINSYSTGIVSGSGGGLIGAINSFGSASTVTNSYYDSETSGKSDTGKGEPKTTAEMKTQATFTGWDFAPLAGDWSINPSGYISYPYLQGFTYDVPEAMPAVNPIPGLAVFVPTDYTWAGGTDEAGEAGNWDNGLPPTGADIVIPEGATPYPVFEADMELGNITIEPNATLTMAPSFRLDVTEDSNITIGAGGKLILKSDGTGTAYIGALTGTSSITGTVLQERYIMGDNRSFRFMGHPFNTAIPLSALGDQIDITGSGTGFTPTATNNPSAFYYDPSTGDADTEEDGGWQAFTSMTDNWNRYQGIRVLVRGSKGQSGSFEDVEYTPDPVTFEWEGEVNTGTQTINLTSASPSGGLSDFNLIGNPYPSAIDLKAITRSVSVGANFYIWQPRESTSGTAGRGGAYLTEPFATGDPTYTLPTGGAFFVRAGAAAQTLTIEEADKVNSNEPLQSVAGSTLRMDAEQASKYGSNSIQMVLSSEGEWWDRSLVFFNAAGANTSQDAEDATKLANPEVNLFTVSADDFAMAIDARPYQESEGVETNINRIPLHILSPARAYTLSLPDFDLEEGRTLRLYDRFTEEYITLAKGTTYDFEVTDDPRTKGHRFDIVMGIEVITSINPGNRRFQAYLLPNPAQEQVRISIQKPDNVATTNIRIVSMTGVEVSNEKLTTDTSELDINLSQLSKGIYLVEITHGTERIVKRLIVN